MNKIAKIGIVSVLAIAGALLTSTLLASSVSANMSLTADGVSPSSDDGQLEKVTVAPSGRTEWQGLDEAPQTIVYKVYIKKAGSNWDQIKRVDIGADAFDGGTTGADDYSLPEIEVNKGRITYEGLDSDTDGQTKKSVLDVKVEAGLWSGSEYIDKVESKTSYQVNCTNQPASSGLDGTANTDASPTSTE